MCENALCHGEEVAEWREGAIAAVLDSEHVLQHEHAGVREPRGAVVLAELGACGEDTTMMLALALALRS